MNRRIRNGVGLYGLCWAWVVVSGCDYSRNAEDPLVAPPPSPPRQGASPKGLPEAAPERDVAERAAILASSIELIQRAALVPGGDNFRLATDKLNQFFDATPQSEYQMDSAMRAYLESHYPRDPQSERSLIDELENRTWSPKRDARHLEDCMLYATIAKRVGGTGDDLTRVNRVFDWTTRQIQLAPAGMLGSRQLPQVIARPYDVLIRGIATESEGFWAERSWLFMVLCRQLGVDVGLLTYTRGNIVEPPPRDSLGKPQTAAGLLEAPKAPKPSIPWICAALVDGKAYLFDARIGLPIPGPGGQGVATLDQVLADPILLERMNLPGQSPYGTSRASLLSSPTKLNVLIDSSPGFFSPKMRLLQRQLAGKNRTILYRDPTEQRDHFAQVLGDRLGEVKLWGVPLEVESQLFTNAQFVQSTLQSLFLFRPEFPLIYARIKHLRGDIPEAIQEYVGFRLRTDVPVVNNNKLVIPKDVQQGLNVYATLYLALAQLERNNLDQAEKMFLMLLEMLPEPGPNQPYYNMFRWGAHANLGRIYEARKDYRQAIAHYSQSDPTMQYHGNLLRARELVWQDPMAAVPDPLPPAPKAP